MVALVWVDRGRVTPRVRGLLVDARKAARIPATSAKVMQGSYSGGVKASAGTHDGGGAADISIAGLTRAEQLKLINELRKRNVCAWLRTPEFGWPKSAGGPHAHLIVRDEPGLSSGARMQVVAYDRGLNGLASKRKDPHPRPKQASVEKVRKAVAAAKKKVVAVAASPAGPILRHPGTVGKTIMHKVPVDKPVTVVGGRWYTVAVIIIPPGGEYACTLQVRIPAGAKTGEAALVRLGWPGLAKEDSTGHNPIHPATKQGDTWYKWRTPIQTHVIAGGGRLAYRVLMPPGNHTMRFVAKATRVT